MSVACVVPTRGLVYAEVIQAINSNLSEQKRSYGPLFVISKPIPDCFNDAVTRGMDTGADYIWIVEEDTVCPEGGLSALLAQNKLVVTIDYPVAKGVSHIQRDKDGTIKWCGIGCTLFHRSVFEQAEKPWFQANKLYSKTSGQWIELTQEQEEKSFGGHDVLFFTNLKEKHNITVSALQGWKGRHLRATEIQKIEHNKGYYTITSL